MKAHGRGGPTPAQMTLLADWLDGRLSESEAETVALQVGADPDMSEGAEWLRELRRAAKGLPLVDPPPLLRQRLRQQYRRWAAPLAAMSKTMELTGTLVFDSRRQTARVAMRGRAGSTPDAQLVWRTEVADLLVEVSYLPEGDRQLNGQVLIEHESSSPVFEVEAFGPGFSVRAQDGDSSGCFSLRVPPTVDALRVSNGQLAITAAIDLTTIEPGTALPPQP